MPDPAGRQKRRRAMRQTIKFLHTFSSCGLVGGLAIYMLVLLKGPQANAAQFADMRATIVVICDFVIVPSLGISLVTGLLAMMVHRPYQEKRWAWAKALMGFAMFESTLAITQSKAGMAATLSARALEGANIAEDLAAALSSEWTALWAITALSVAQIAFGIWRPKLEFGKRPAQKAPSPAS